MSVTFASGIIPTSLLINPETSIIRFSVTTKYRRHQRAIFEPCHTKSTNHKSQINPTNPPLPVPAIPLRTPAAKAPARIRSARRNDGYRVHPDLKYHLLGRQEVLAHQEGQLADLDQPWVHKITIATQLRVQKSRMRNSAATRVLKPSGPCKAALKQRQYPAPQQAS